MCLDSPEPAGARWLVLRAERLTAQAIREGKNIEAIVTEILETETRRK
jgi:hypothetical protein